MSEKDDKSNPALRKLTDLRTRLARESPDFARAQAVEANAERFCESVRQSLIKARRDAGWDQAELARRVDYSQSTISRLESGKGDLSLKVLFRLASALGKQPAVVLRDGTDVATDQIRFLELAEVKLKDRLQETIHEIVMDSIDEVKSREGMVE